MTGTVLDVATPVGPARVRLEAPDGSRGLLALGHGAGGVVDAPDLVAARRAAHAHGLAVALVEQPWRVAGRRVAAPAPRLDTAWTAVLEALAPSGPLVLGGRSSGARVACRTAGALGADAVLALAFPLVPPGTDRNRLEELQRPAVPRLVVQGDRDAFGCPPAQDGVQVHVVAGADHSFAVRRVDGRTRREVLDDVEQAVLGWLRQTLT